MASIDRSDPVILGHVLAEHRDLFKLMTTVRAAFATTAIPTPAHRDSLIAALRDLRTHLAAHFVQEERGGFLEESVARMPRLSKRVRAILDQHPDLLAELDRMIEGLQSASFGPAAWARADHAFGAFTEHMTAHERSENSVVQEGYNEDLGLVE